MDDVSCTCKEFEGLFSGIRVLASGLSNSLEWLKIHQPNIAMSADAELLQSVITVAS